MAGYALKLTFLNQTGLFLKTKLLVPYEYIKTAYLTIYYPGFTGNPGSLITVSFI